jgi:hypothetical protein
MSGNLLGMREQEYQLATVMPNTLRPRWVVPLVAVLAGLLVTSLSLNLWQVLDHASATQAPSEMPSAAVATAAVDTTTPAPRTAQPAHRLGDRVPLADGLVDTTVLAYKQPVAVNAPNPGAPNTEWGAADVRVCARIETITVSESSWAITYADGGVIEPSNRKYVYFPEPEYPIVDRPVEAGRCVRGWIVFPALKGKRPAAVEYAPDGFVPVVWLI